MLYSWIRQMSFPHFGKLSTGSGGNPVPCSKLESFGELDACLRRHDSEW
jgi:hypothetical protein